MAEHKIGLNNVHESDPLRGLVLVGSQGTCTCGWRGKLRKDGKAGQDAAEHHANATAAETLAGGPDA